MTALTEDMVREARTMERTKYEDSDKRRRLTVEAGRGGRRRAVAQRQERERAEQQWGERLRSRATPADPANGRR